MHECGRMESCEDFCSHFGVSYFYWLFRCDMEKPVSCLKFQLQNLCSYLKSLVKLNLKPVLMPFSKSYRSHCNGMRVSLAIVFNLQQVLWLVRPLRPGLGLGWNHSRPTAFFLGCGNGKTIFGAGNIEETLGIGNIWKGWALLCRCVFQPVQLCGPKHFQVCSKCHCGCLMFYNKEWRKTTLKDWPLQAAREIRDVVGEAMQCWWCAGEPIIPGWTGYHSTQWTYVVLIKMNTNIQRYTYSALFALPTCRN